MGVYDTSEIGGKVLITNMQIYNNIRATRYYGYDSLSLEDTIIETKFK